MTAALALFLALYLTMVLGLRIIHALHFRHRLNETWLSLLTCAAWATFFYLTFTA